MNNLSINILTQDELDELTNLYLDISLQRNAIKYNEDRIEEITENAAQRLANLIYFCNHGYFPDEKGYVYQYRIYSIDEWTEKYAIHDN